MEGEKLFKFCLVFSVFALFLVKPISADGMIHFTDPDMHGWRLRGQDRQLAAINYDEGVENMIIEVNMESFEGEKASWIFPVPSKPEETEIDILKSFPRLTGYDIEEETEKTVDNVFMSISATQIYPPLFQGIFILGENRWKSMGMGSGPGVSVHKHIEKAGVTSELVTAENGSRLYNYLKKKNMDIPSKSKSVLEEYIGEKYSFVISWISDLEKLRQSVHQSGSGTLPSVGLSLEFPSEKSYYPLKPTGVYGESRVPIAVYFMGHVTPETPEKIRDHTDVRYFTQNTYEVPSNLTSFFGRKGTIKELKYTKVDINTESKELTEDLWARETTPQEVELQEGVRKCSWLWGAAVFIFISCLASVLSGLIVFSGDKPSPGKFALLGLSNSLSLIGFSIVSYLGEVDEKFTERKSSEKASTAEGSLIRTLKVSAGIFVAISALVWIFFSGPLTGYLYSASELLISAMVVAGFITALAAPISYIFFKKKVLARFIVIFSIIFMILTSISFSIINSVVF